MTRLDFWTDKLNNTHRLVINKKNGWIRIIRILGGQWRYETSEGIDLLFNNIEDVLQEVKRG